MNQSHIADLRTCEIESLVGREYQEPFGCWNLVHEALSLIGVHVPDYSQGLDPHERSRALQERLELHAHQVADPERGDLVLLRIMGEPGHIGVMVNQKEMLHCMAVTNAVIERVDSMRWRGRVLGYWRAD